MQPTSPMTLHHAHPWDVTPKEAVTIQRELAPLVREEPLPAGIESVAGLDVSVRGDQVRAAIVVIRTVDCEVVDRAIWEGPVAFPYIPGLLSFREIPAILRALEKLRALPDVLMLDGQGIAHPRRFGLACHLGVLLDRPALGVGKTKLVGDYAEPANRKGSTADLHHKGDLIGQVVRTRENVKPVFVSYGHRCTLNDAVDLTLRLTTKYRLPEPTRLAHRLSYAGMIA